MFFTKPFERSFDRLPEDMADKLIEDITKNI